MTTTTTTTINKSTLAGVLNNTGVSGFFRAINLGVNMVENVMEDLEAGQELDRPLKLEERNIKRMERANLIANMQAEMTSRMEAAQVQRELASLNASIELSKVKLDLAIAKSKKDRLEVFEDTTIPMAQKMAMITAIQNSITAKIAAYNALFQEPTALSTIATPTTKTGVDMSQYEDFATVSDDDDVIL